MPKQGMAARPDPPAARVAAVEPAAQPDSRIERLIAYLLRPVHSHGLSLFTRVFGAALAVDGVAMARSGEMADYFGVENRLHFSYGWPLPPLPPLRPSAMIALPYIIIATAALVSVGVLQRLNLAILTTCWSYLFLVDAARYVNHHYLYALLGAYLTLTGATGRCRRAHLLVLRLQWTVIYVHATLTKATTDFLVRHEPITSYLRLATADGRTLAPLRPLLTTELAAAISAIFAISYDLLIPIALWRVRTDRRCLAPVLAVRHALIYISCHVPRARPMSTWHRRRSYFTARTR